MKDVAIYELRSASRMVIRHARIGDFYPQPWVLACMIERAVHLEQPDVIVQIRGILEYTASRFPAGN